ncbi:MAG TPA: carboxypeptidase regulatory-like domain-containing protein [Terriglobales bacterium]|nr:carboxypeptidase regulatory-like domain-containing protein [Terriglobales bacterium]
MRRRRCQVFAVAAFFLIVACVAAAQVTSPDFSVVVLPDTQYYSESHPEIFTAQTQWIVNNRSNYNIQFVLHEGDIVNIAEQPAQWQNADAAMRLLDAAQIPYVAPPGNHDYDGEMPSGRGTTAFNAYFGPSRYAQYGWYKGGFPSGTNDNSYAVFTVNGQQYLVLSLEFIPRDSALAWARTVLDANADKEIIVVTHSYMWVDSTRADECNNNDLAPTNGNQGEDIWQKLLNNYPNVSLVLSGHFTAATASRRAELGLHQNLVNQIFANYQQLTNGGNGWLRIMTFRPSLNRIDVVTYSPFLNQYMTDGENQFSIAWHNAGLAGTTGAITGLVRGDRMAPAQYMCVPIAGVTLAAGGATAQTDSNGLFSLTLPNGNYSLSASAPGWRAPAESDQQGAYAGFPSNAKVFLKPMLGSVAGKVTDPSGNPVGGAALAFSGGAIPTALNVTTDAGGNYAASSLSVGTYQVTASASGQTTATTTATIADGATTTLNIQFGSANPPPPPPPPPPAPPCAAGTAHSGITICFPGSNQLTLPSSGGSGSIAISVYNSTSAAVAVSLACTADSASTGCSLNPASVNLQANGSSTATVNFTVPALAGRLHPPFPLSSPLVFAGLLAGFAGIAVKRRARAPMLFALALAIMLVSCGGGSSPNITTPPAPPSSSPTVNPAAPSPKTYNFTVTATSGANSDTKAFQVTVQ